MKTGLRVLAALLLTSVLGAGATRADGHRPGLKVTLGGKRVTKAGGDSRAWLALRPVLPESVIVAGQVNLAALRGSELFNEMHRILLHQGGPARELLDAARIGCDLDLSQVVQDVAFALIDADHDHLLVAVSLKGLGEADLVRCAETAVSRQGQGKRFEVKHTGNLSEYIAPGGPEHFYAVWLAPDVVAFTSEPTERELVAPLLAGKGGFAGGAAARRAFTLVVPGAAAWAVFAKDEHLDSYELKLAAGSLNVSAGQLVFDVSLVMADPGSARKAAADWTAQRDQLVSGTGNVPPLIGQLIKTVQIGAVDDVVRVTVAVPEKDFLALFSVL